MTHVKTIDLKTATIKEGIWVEVIRIYKEYLLIIDEKKGKLFSFYIKTNHLNEIKTIGKDVSSIKRSVAWKELL
jgi:hypothetical protein